MDPIYDGLARLAVSTMVSALNAEIIRQAAAEGIDLAESELGPRVENLSPDVIAEPTTAKTQNVAPTEPSVLNFFASGGAGPRHPAPGHHPQLRCRWCASG